MDWANLERLAHQEARQSSARKLNNTYSVSLSTPAFDRIASRSQQSQPTLDPTATFDQTIRSVSQETNATLMEELSNMRRNFYGLTRNVQDIQENLTKNLEMAYELKKGKDIVEMRCDEFDKFIKSLNTNQQLLIKETEAIQYSVQKIISSHEQMQLSLTATRDSHLSRDTFSKVMDATSSELRLVKEGVNELFKTSDRSSIQIENLLLSIIDLGSVQPATEADNLSLLRSLASDGFANQVRRILTESLQAGVDLSLQKHLKVLQSSMNQSIVVMLKEYRERQNANLLPDIEKLRVLFDEFTKVREEFVTLHASFNSLKAQVEVERLRAPPALPPTPEIITVDESVRTDLDAARQEIIALQEQVTKLQSQMNTQTENLNSSTASQEVLRLSIQENRNYLIAEHDKAQSKTEIMVRDAEEKLGDLLGRTVAPLDRKIKDVSDRNLSLSMDVQKMKDDVDRQNRELSQQLLSQDAAIREEMKNLLHVNQLDHEEIRREIIRNIRSSEIISIQDDITAKTDQRLQALHQEQQIFMEKLKGLASEIDGCHSKLINEKEDVRLLLNQRDLDISKRLQERIVHWENCQKDWQSLQEARIDETNRQMVALSTDLKEIKPQENIERLKDEVANIQERFQGLKSKQDVMDIGLRKENDALRNDFSKQFQIIQEKLLGVHQLIDAKQHTNEQVLKSFQEKATNDFEKTQEQVGIVTLKQRTQELDIKEAKDHIARFEAKITTLDSELQETLGSKLSILDGKTASNLQMLEVTLSKEIKECDVELQLLRKEHANISTRVDEHHQETLQKWSHVTEIQQRQTQELEKLISQKVSEVEQGLEKTKRENDHNLEAIAAQEEQFSRLLEQHEADIKMLHDQFQRQKELHDTEITTTRSILRSDQHKQSKTQQEAIDEIRFDLSQTANRVLILEQTSSILNLHHHATDSSHNINAAINQNLEDKVLSSKSSAAIGEIDVNSLKRDLLEAILPLMQQKAELSDIKSMKHQMEEQYDSVESLKKANQTIETQLQAITQEAKLKEEDWEKTFESTVRAISQQSHREITSLQQELSFVKVQQQQQHEAVQECTTQVSQGVLPLLSRQREEMIDLRDMLHAVKEGQSALKYAEQEKETEVYDMKEENNEVKLANEPRIPLPSVPMATVKQLNDLEKRLSESVKVLQSKALEERENIDLLREILNEKQAETISKIENDRAVSKASIDAVHRLLDVLQEEIGKHDDAQQQHYLALEKLETGQKSLQASLTTIYATLTTHIEDHARWNTQHHQQQHSYSQPPSKPSSPPSIIPESPVTGTASLTVSAAATPLTASLSPHVSPHGLRAVSQLRSLCAGSRSVDGIEENDDDVHSVTSFSSSTFSSPNKQQQQSQTPSKRPSQTRAIEELVKDTSPDNNANVSLTSIASPLASTTSANNLSVDNSSHINANTSAMRTFVKLKPAVKELAPVVAPISLHHGHHHNNSAYHTPVSRRASPAIDITNSNSSNNSVMMFHQPTRLVKSPAPGNNAPLSSNSNSNNNIGGMLPKQIPLGPLSPMATPGQDNSVVSMHPSPPSAGKSPSQTGVSPRMRVTTPSKHKSSTFSIQSPQSNSSEESSMPPSPADNIHTSSFQASPAGHTQESLILQQHQQQYQEGTMTSPMGTDASFLSSAEPSPEKQPPQHPSLSRQASNVLEESQTSFASSNSVVSSPEFTPPRPSTQNTTIQQQQPPQPPQQTALSETSSLSLDPKLLFASEQVQQQQQSQQQDEQLLSETSQLSNSFDVMSPMKLDQDTSSVMSPATPLNEEATSSKKEGQTMEESSFEQSTMSVGEEAAVNAGTIHFHSSTATHIHNNDKSNDVVSVIHNAENNNNDISASSHPTEEKEENIERNEDKFVSDSSSSSSSSSSTSSSSSPSSDVDNSEAVLYIPTNKSEIVMEDVSGGQQFNNNNDDDGDAKIINRGDYYDGTKNDRNASVPVPSSTVTPSTSAGPSMVVSGSLLGRANATAITMKKKK